MLITVELIRASLSFQAQRVGPDNCFPDLLTTNRHPNTVREIHPHKPQGIVTEILDLIAQQSIINEVYALEALDTASTPAIDFLKKIDDGTESGAVGFHREDGAGLGREGLEGRR